MILDANSFNSGGFVARIAREHGSIYDSFLLDLLDLPFVGGEMEVQLPCVSVSIW